MVPEYRKRLKKLGFRLRGIKLIREDKEFNLKDRITKDTIETFFQKSKGTDYKVLTKGKFTTLISPERFNEDLRLLKKQLLGNATRKLQKAADMVEYRKPVDLTSSDYDVIIELINKWLMKYEDKQQYAMKITLLMTTSAKRGVIYETAKSFPAERIEDRYIIYDDMMRWGEGFKGPDADYSVKVDMVLMTIIQENAGGCRPKREKIEKINKEIYINPHSDKNNCFFKCVQEELKIGRVSEHACNQFRTKYGIPKNSPITVSKAIEIFKSCARSDVKFAIYDAEAKKLHGDEDYDIKLLLKDGHYMRYINDNILKKCNECGLTYKKKHTCHPKCPKCGVNHGVRQCNKDKIRFYQSQILKSKTRYAFGNIKNEPLNQDIIHFDIETHIRNSNNTHQAYIIGYNEANEFKYFAGNDCLQQFLKNMIDRDENLILNAFNGSAFDFQLIINAAYTMSPPLKPDYKFNNGRLLFMKIGKLKFFDIARHTQGSLKENLKALNCSILKGDFDHSKADEWDNMTDKLKNDCIKYLHNDVMGLKQLYEKLNGSIHQEHGTNIYNYISTSQLTYNIGMKTMENNIVLPTIEEDSFYRKAIYGGRTYPSKKEFVSTEREKYLNGEMKFDDIKDYIIDSDVVSLYPSAMALFQYPCDDKPIQAGKHLLEYLNKQLKETGRVAHMGIYEIRYKANKNLTHAILPRRGCGAGAGDDARGPRGGALHWDLTNSQGVYTSVDIENATEYGYEVEILNGYCWKAKDYVFKSYIESLFKKKAKSQKGTPEYLLAKLFMNAFYGKLIQRPIHEENRIIKTNAEFWKFFGTHRITEMEYIGTEQIYLSGINRDESKLEQKISKPSYLGAFVLAYSRRIMLNHMSKANPYLKSDDPRTQKESIKNDFYYTDTDAIQIHADNAKNLTFGKNLGDIANDLGDNAKILNGIYIAPKLYCLEYAAKYGIQPGLKPETRTWEELPGKVCDCHDTGKQCIGSIHYHFRGKGVSASCLKKDVFDKMAKGEQVKLVQDFQMKRINLKRNSKQQEYEQFSIVHNKDIVKALNTKQWEGREFQGNDSVPYK